MIAAIAACNTGLALPYGHDELSQRLERKVSDIFEREVSVFLVSTGSAANALSLATLTPPWGSMLSHAEAHINRDECGAPEFYTNAGGGCTMILQQSIRPAAGLTEKASARSDSPADVNQRLPRLPVLGIPGPVLGSP